MVQLTQWNVLDPQTAMRDIAAAVNDAVANKFPDAPMDGKLYGRMRGSWTPASGLQGPQGEPGPVGPQGVQGPPGVAGPAGDTGPAGPQGIPGPVGPQGLIGLTGPQGTKGDTGAVGPQGTIGPQGPKGDTGAQGTQGVVGPAGSQGPPGSAGGQGPAGPTAVSADAGNLAKLGTDSLLLVPDSAVHKGVVDGSNAVAGNLGEQLAVSQTTAVSLTTAVTANVATLALTAGDWTVSGVIVFTGGTNVLPTALSAAVATVSATLPTPAQVVAGTGNLTQYNLPFTKSAAQTMQAGICRINVSATTNVYLAAQGTFTGGTLTATGYISARRVR